MQFDSALEARRRVAVLTVLLGVALVGSLGGASIAIRHDIGELQQRRGELASEIGIYRERLASLRQQAHETTIRQAADHALARERAQRELWTAERKRQESEDLRATAEEELRVLEEVRDEVVEKLDKAIDSQRGSIERDVVVEAASALRLVDVDETLEAAWDAREQPKEQGRLLDAAQTALDRIARRYKGALPPSLAGRYARLAFYREDWETARKLSFEAMNSSAGTSVERGLWANIFTNAYLQENGLGPQAMTHELADVLCSEPWTQTSTTRTFRCAMALAALSQTGPKADKAKLVCRAVEVGATISEEEATRARLNKFEEQLTRWNRICAKRCGALEAPPSGCPNPEKEKEE